ncbi:MAG: outer membrane beta-barrel protein, partial [Flavisolibacter sp.]|nr:outer membrane beta-barrel protein [Flavisolibacter sp.]
MQRLLWCLFFIGCTHFTFAQSTVKGKVADTLDKKNLQNAVVSFLKKSDSALLYFTRTTKTGEFLIHNVAPESYVMLVTFPGFADFADYIEVKNQPETDLGVIPLTLKAKLLDAVIIKSAGAVRIKGDTTEFVADSFKLKEGATVEDLLRRLPGFQVNSKGEITAQGQRVGKVLVDGEEFFGDDPTMATQNIGAKSVDKVQVYDTKSDQQNLTGISSGTETKTVNIKLKEDAKKGSFGKAYAGSDFSKLVDAKALYNKFAGKKKISFYGTKSDISTGSLNWEDRQKLGIEENYEYDEISGYYYSFGSSDDFNDWSLRGLPHSYTAGGLYTNKWNADKNSINGSYRYNRLATDNSASTLTQILTDSINYQNKYQDTKGLVQQHSGNAKYEWKIDSLASLRFTVAGVYKTNQLQSNTHSEFLNEDRSYINKSTQVIDNETERKQIDNEIQYKQLFNKKNRLLIATLRLGYVDDKQDGIIQTNTDFYKSNLVYSSDISDQQKLMNGHSKTIGSKITFSEPLNAKWATVLEYAHNENASVSHRNTYNKDNLGKYSIIDDVFSNNFDLNVFSNSGTAILKYTTQKLRAAFGSGISNVKLKLYDLDSNRRNNYNFLNLTPQVSVGYTFKPQTRLSFNYRGTTRQPTIDQLQPIRDNQDPLNIFIGNPDLKVGFNHNINASFN